MKFFFTTISPFRSYASYKRATGLGQALAKLGHTVYIAALDCEENRKAMAFEAPDCNPVWFPKTNAFAEVSFKLKAIRRIQPDYVYSPTYGLRNLMGCKMLFPKGTKLLQEINELNSAFFPSHRLVWKTIELLGTLEADVQICASKMLQNHVDETCKAWKIRRKSFYSPFAYPPYLHATHNTRNTAKTLVYMGNLTKEYGIFEILEAFKKLSKRRNDVRLIVIGAGPDADNAKNFICQNNLSGSVEMAGRVAENELNDWLQKADAFVLPMHDTKQDKYRCPSKIYYYIAYNKPIVTCKIGDPFNALGIHGFYYNHDDINGMAEVASLALDNSYDIFTEDFVSSHSWTGRARQLLTVLH